MVLPPSLLGNGGVPMAYIQCWERAELAPMWSVGSERAGTYPRGRILTPLNSRVNYRIKNEAEVGVESNIIRCPTPHPALR